ncbi:MAG TPA: hypothetical protein VF881_11670 [Polyangiaceae bacterium]
MFRLGILALGTTILFAHACGGRTPLDGEVLLATGGGGGTASTTTTTLTTGSITTGSGGIGTNVGTSVGVGGSIIGSGGSAGSASTGIGGFGGTGVAGSGGAGFGGGGAAGWAGSAGSAGTGGATINPLLGILPGIRPTAQCIDCVDVRCNDTPECSTNPLCVKGVACFVAMCGALPSNQQFGCALKCFNGNLAVLSSAAQAIACIYGACGRICGGGATEP